MVPQLRRRHKWIWLILTIFLPLGFITSYSLISQTQNTVTTQSLTSEPAPLSKIASIRQTPQFDIHLREDNTLGLKQIEVTLNESLSRPSTHLYLSDKSSKEIEDAQFLGILGAKGTHRFNLNPSLTYQKAFVLLFYDKIAGEIYEEIQLK